MSIRLGNICGFQSGGTPSKSNKEYFGGNIPWITTTALNGAFIDENDAIDWITEKAIAESAAKIVPANSILIGTRVGIGKTAVNRIPMSTSQDIISLIGLDEKTWDKNYLCKFLQSKSGYLNSQARGATIKGIKIDVLSSLEVPEISIDEQKSIADSLDRVKHIIASRKKEIDLFDNLIKARFVEMFGHPDLNEKKWDVYKLGTLCKVSSSRRIHQNELSAEGIPFLRISDLIGRIETGTSESGLFIPITRYNELKDRGMVPKAGDILLTARGTLGRCYIIKSADKFYFQDGMITWLSDFDERITANYLAFLFSVSCFRKQIDSLQAGTTVAYLSISMTQMLNVMLPPLESQNRFTDFIKQVDKSKVAVQKALKETQILFDSLMQKYFG